MVSVGEGLGELGTDEAQSVMVLVRRALPGVRVPRSQAVLAPSPVSRARWWICWVRGASRTAVPIG